MTAPREQDVMSLMGESGLGQCVEAICDLLIALNYEDVARELRVRYDYTTEVFDE